MSASPRRRTTTKLLASAAIIAAVGAFVSVGVFSAFSQTQSNSSTLSSAAFSLTQSPSTGLFGTIGKLIPGDLITRCVRLKNTSDVPVTVTAKPSMTGGAGTLLDVMTVKLQEVTGIAADATDEQIRTCTGTLTATRTLIGDVLGSALADTPLTAADASNTWAVNESHDYRVIMSLPSTVNTTYAGKESGAVLNFLAEQLAGGEK